MAKSLVVESPAKAKTINKYLGPGFIVEASVGHIKDLPKSKLGIDMEYMFAPSYTTVREGNHPLSEKACRNVERDLPRNRS